MATEVPGGLLSAPPPPPLGSLRVGLQLPRLEGEVKETPFRPPQPCPPPARTPPLPSGLSAAPVPAELPAAHSNLLLCSHVDRQHLCSRDGLPRSVGRDRGSRSRRASVQAGIWTAPEVKGRGMAEAAPRRPRGRGGWGGGSVRVTGGAGHRTRPAGSRTSLQRPLGAGGRVPCWRLRTRELLEGASKASSPLS